MNYYRFLAYGGARYNTDKVIGLMMNNRLKGAENLVRGGILNQPLPAGVTARRWFGLQDQSASGVLIDELANGNVELYYPNDFGNYTDALTIFLLLLTYAQLDVKVQIIAPDGSVTENLLTEDAADVERQMSDWLKQQMLAKIDQARSEGQCVLPGFHCTMTLTREMLDTDFMDASAEEIVPRLFTMLTARQWG